MRVASTIVALLCGCLCNVAARTLPRSHTSQRDNTHFYRSRSPIPSQPSSKYQYLTRRTKPFAVNGSSIPEVDFDIGESYAGLLSIDDNPKSGNALYFWFHPSTNVHASDEISIWLNGGPGVSSMEGLIQENGPFLWQPGTYQPIRNRYSWSKLTNVVWIDQPIGTGFSTAAPGAPEKVIDEDIVAQQFMGFWKNFVKTFSLNHRKVYLVGESYAGQYIPYIAHSMLEANDTEFYNVQGIQINDPTINWGDTLQNAPVAGMVAANQNLFNLNTTAMEFLESQSVSCGYKSFMDNALSFPPKHGKLSTAPSSDQDGCSLWYLVAQAAVYVNPCFNVYNVRDYCPYLWDVIGYPSLGWGPRNYFNRSDVQKAINAPPTSFKIQGNAQLGLNEPGDQSVPSGLGPLPSIIDRTNNVIIGNGMLDFLIIANGTLATIQNMTWNGKQGFQSRPSDPFFVPYGPGFDLDIAEISSQPADAVPVESIAGAGNLGVVHHERGLTFASVAGAGHQMPQYQPGAAFRLLEYLLGRVESLSTVGNFTVEI